MPLLALLVDVRVDVSLIVNKSEGSIKFVPGGAPEQAFRHKHIWIQFNKILSAILGQKDVRLGWRGRHNVGLAIAIDGKTVIPDLDALSAGQVTLLCIFGTLIRYADSAGTAPPVLSLSDITGICLVDEIDAHMHIELQHEILPSLIKLFPKVQFIVSSHSPLFVLGMEKALGTEGMAIFDMPTGTSIKAESYAEFGRALEVLRDTEAFNIEIAKVTETPGKLLVLLEGETDPMYLQTAAELLDRKALLDQVEFAWIGARYQKGSRSFHTGKDALNATLKFFRAKPELVKRTVMLLYDSDANKPDETHDRLYVRSAHKNPDGIKAGIENLLPKSAITKDMYDVRENNDGGKHSTLNKIKLCTYLCKATRDPKDFDAFSPLLDMVEEIAKDSRLHQGNGKG